MLASRCKNSITAPRMRNPGRVFAYRLAPVHAKIARMVAAHAAAATATCNANTSTRLVGLHSLPVRSA